MVVHCGNCSFAYQTILAVESKCVNCGHINRFPSEENDKPSYADYRTGVRMSAVEAHQATFGRMAADAARVARLVQEAFRNITDPSLTFKGIALIPDETVPPNEFRMQNTVKCQRCQDPIALGKYCDTCIDAARMRDGDSIFGCASHVRYIDQCDDCRRTWVRVPQRAVPSVDIVVKGDDYEIREPAPPVKSWTGTLVGPQTLVVPLPEHEPDRSYAALGWKYWQERFETADRERLKLGDSLQLAEDENRSILVENAKLRRTIETLERKSKK